MALENLVRLAERISSLPDEALAQIAQTEGIEPVIAASELKNRQDIRAEAAAQPQQNPSVVEQLIQRAMGQQQQPQGMPQQGMQQQGMPQQMPPQMPPQGPPQMPPQMPPQGPPMASMGGLLRRFSNGGLTDEQLMAMGFDPETMTQADYMSIDPEAFERAVLEAQKPFYEGDVSGRATFGDWGRTFQAVPAAEDLSRAEYREKYPDLASGAALSGRARREAEREFTETYSPEYFAKNPQHLSLLRQAGGDRSAFEALVNRAQQLPPPTSEEGDITTVADAITKFGIGDGQPPLEKKTDDKTTDKKTPSPQQTEYQRRVGIRPDQSLYHDSRRGDLLRTAGAQFLANMQQDSLIPLGRVSDPHSTELSRKLSKLDADDMKRMQGYNDEIDKYMSELDELEKDIPDRKSIKDRFKKQVDYGVAHAFFSAAEKGSPDFMTAMASALAGSSEVMNKLTGQEQKELYKHATDAYTRKAGRANASFKQRTELGKQIKDRAATTATTRTNAIAARRLQLDAADKQMQRNISIYEKAMASAKNASDVDVAWANYQRSGEDDFTDNWTALAKDPTTGIISNPVQHKRELAPAAAMLGVTSAQRIVNEGLRHNFKELWKLKGQAEKDPEIADPVQNAMREYMEQLRDGDQTTKGDLALMNRYATEIMAALQLGGTPDGALALLQSSHPWMNLPMTGGDVD